MLFFFTNTAGAPVFAEFATFAIAAGFAGDIAVTNDGSKFPGIIFSRIKYAKHEYAKTSGGNQFQDG